VDNKTQDASVSPIREAAAELVGYASDSAVALSLIGNTACGCRLNVLDVFAECAAFLGFGSDVADEEAAGATGETAVGY
jgi:hypothetical protein